MQYDLIHVSPAIGREDGTFGFGFFEYDTNLDVFIQNAEKEIDRVKNGNGLSFSENRVLERHSGFIFNCLYRNRDHLK